MNRKKNNKKCFASSSHTVNFSYEQLEKMSEKWEYVSYGNPFNDQIKVTSWDDSVNELIQKHKKVWKELSHM